MGKTYRTEQKNRTAQPYKRTREKMQDLLPNEYKEEQEEEYRLLSETFQMVEREGWE